MQVNSAQEMAQLGWVLPEEARAAWAVQEAAALAAWARPGEARAAGAAQPEVAVLTLPMVQVVLVELPGRRAAALVVAEREKLLVPR